MINRDELIKDLRKCVIEVFFTKVNGEQRAMRCTLRPDILPPNYVNEETEEKTFHQKNTDVIAAWDVTKGGWRSFRVDSVSYIQDVNENY
jgi:hypothetical protein